MKSTERQSQSFSMSPDPGRRREVHFGEGDLSVGCKIETRMNGFTLIELMIVLVIIAILAAIALPAYGRYVKQGRAKSASSDLVALSLNLENAYQRKLQYPAETTDTTVKTQDLAPGWYPSEKDYFTYTMDSKTATYVVYATGTGSMSGCNLSLSSKNERAVTSEPCGGVTSW